jgi:hypothetical protein
MESATDAVAAHAPIQSAANLAMSTPNPEVGI